MNRTKKIYFLAAFVLIIGCYVLNLSYSLFVQTEEKEIVSETIPTMSYNLENGAFTIPANSSQAITLKVNNTGEADINFGLNLAETLTTNQKIQLVNLGGNDITGTVEGLNSKEIKLFVTNNASTPLNLNFDLIANYSTLNLNYTDAGKIDRTDKYKLNLNDSILSDSRIAHYEEPPASYGTLTAGTDGLYTNPDDYGTSYYIRGKITSNYVKFAGFIWRVVRINGDNTIRLILDGSLDKVTREGETAVAGALSQFNSATSHKAYIGFMYGSTSSTSYSTIHQNSTKSIVLQTLNTFYEKYLKSSTYNYESYLADTLFCGDKVITSIVNRDATYIEEATYAASNRGNQPSLECAAASVSPSYTSISESVRAYSRYTSTLVSSTSTSKSVRVNNNLSHPIGLLSLDELKMAASNGYLTDPYNYTTPLLSTNWWTMSPIEWEKLHNGREYVYHATVGVGTSSGWSSSNVTGSYAVRPVINLKANLEVNDGDGTQNNPYVIG